MRIAWFTPFHKSSAIGRFSRAVTAELGKFADVNIWYPPAEETHVASVGSICHPDDATIGPEALASYDLCVYNMGDQIDFHRQAFLASRRVPGVVVLHDFVMHHFFAAHYLTDHGDKQEYYAAMTRLYGEAGRLAALPVVNGTARGVWESDRVIEFPFFEEAIRGAYGVIVHSEFFREAVAEVYPGPVKRLFLAYDGPGQTRPPLSRRDLQIPDDKLLVVTIGHANPNKRILEVIEAIGNSKRLSGQLIFAVVGLCQGPYEEILRRAIRKFGLENTIRLAGRVSDEDLSSYLMHADICVNLRYPAMEGASASTIEEMLYGKPVIVTDSGFCSELPLGAVCKITPGNEVKGIGQALCRLAGDPELRKGMGDRAKRFATGQAQASRYAEGFLDFANEVTDALPILKFTDRLAAQMSAMGVCGDRPLVGTVAEDAWELFCSSGRDVKPLPE
jgi:glycosyltransferase involved in cell wall biosynthesis